MINVFHGLNGSGKTSILESISVCSFSKTFLPVSDQSLVRFGENTYNIRLSATNDLNVPYKISINYTRGSKKQIKSSLGDNLLPKDIIGEIPLVILSPDYKSITFGSPQDRRDFIDRLLCQAGKIYFEELAKTKRILKQRNNILTNYKLNRQIDLTLFDVWTNEFINAATEVAIRRFLFLKDFQPIFKSKYSFISDSDEKVGLEYVPDSIKINSQTTKISKEEILNYYKQAFNSLKEEELRRGTTLFGPQKDDIRITINGATAKEVASQGQHKSLLISLKFAEFNFLLEKRAETPIILLDDIFSELDNARIEKVFLLLKELNAQSFITITNADFLKELLLDQKISNFYFVNKGNVFLDIIE